MRTAIIGGIVALVVAGVVIATQVGGGHPRDDGVSGAPEVFRDPPFTVRLAGPLWRARTLQDNDGAQDFALVESDLALDVRATGDSRARIAELELLGDGQSRRGGGAPCPSGRRPGGPGGRGVPPPRALPPG